MPLVAGIDSSTQSCKVAVHDAESGRLERLGSAPHPPGTEVDPEAWWSALRSAVERAGGLDDVAAVSVAAQQHGLVALDRDGSVIRPALLWNDVRSADAAADLVRELGGGDEVLGATRWAGATGTVPVASITVAKLRWLADHEPECAERLAAVCLPHDWLTWRLLGSGGLDRLVTDRSDASGTGWFDPAAGEYRRDLLALALRRPVTEVGAIVLPRVLDPGRAAGRAPLGGAPRGVLVGPGCGDNAGAALGLGLAAGEVCLSIGTSGVAAAVSATPTHDPNGYVAGFADAAGAFLPLVCTLNGSRVLDATASLLGVDHDGLDELALSGPPGAGGLVHVPYLEGERTPNLPTATGSLDGMTLGSMTRPNLARAAVEGLLCHLADALDALRRQGVTVSEVTLTGGGTRSRAVRALAPGILGLPVRVPEPGEYVATGAARQAAWVLAGGDAPPTWRVASPVTEAEPQPWVRERYREVVDRRFG
jgi:xylulokinase